ncbi:MAG: acyl-CoA dehydrogenase family protein, partial [Rhodocyclaceae bacterium]|nr:acyl-CoA dehydrogenase family protein [Rhodocyclaceae bacterium]
MNHPPPTSGRAIECALALAPGLAERAGETERTRAVPAESWHELHASGLMRILQPRRVGGAELPFATLVEVSAVLARACGSTAWVFGNLASHQWMLGMWPAAAQHEVWGPAGETAATPIAASLIFPAGRACREGAGWRLSGRWSFVSGVESCGWIMLGAVAVDDEDAPLGEKHGEYRLYLLPREDYEVRDTWQVVGLAGTRSDEVIVRDKWVPEHRTLALADTQGGPTPGAALNPGPLYRIPLLATFGYVVAGVPIGLAEGMLKLFTDENRSRLASYSGRALADFPAIQAKLAEAAALADCARALALRRCEEIMQLAVGGASPEL